MSVLIRGWKMPGSCGLCSFEHEAYFLCTLTKSNTLEAHKNHKRMNDCPLVEVPLSEVQQTIIEAEEEKRE